MSTPFSEAASSAAGAPSVAERFPSSLFERLAGRISLASTAHQRAPLHAPTTGELLYQVPLCTAEDVREAVRRAREVQKEWARRTFKERARVFLRFHDRLLRRQDAILDIIQAETGKSRKHAFEEIADTANASRYYALHGEAPLRPRRRRGAFPALTATWELHHPLGVIGFIEPWNYPLSLAVTDAVPALLAGNAVVLKPAEQTPFCALWAMDQLAEAGLPEGLFQAVTGRGRDLGTPLIQSADFVCFTGSTATGRIVARQAGERLIGCSLELGGKNPMLVLADADIDRAARGAVRGSFANAGQLCIAMERIYVHASIFEQFLKRFAELTRSLKLGASFDYDMDMGSLISREQLDKVDRHVKDAVAKGATVAAGGRPRPDLGPFFYEPTILLDVTEKMELYKEETFGPVVSVYRFESIDEAIEKANATPYGLNASIWTNDTRLGRKLGARIQAGTVNINEAYAAGWGSMDAPMGGVKDSGLGRRHGAEGILKYTEAQTLSVQRLLPVAAPPGVSERAYSRALGRALSWIRWIPGIR